MTAADDHRQVAATFSARVSEVAEDAWDLPSPVDGWRTRDVVRHLVEWLPAYIVGSGGPALPPGPSVDDDPVAAWRSHVAGVQALLDDPDSAATLLRNLHTGEMRLDDAIARIYTPDVFMHTWDLSRAAGLDETLDPQRCASMLAGWEAAGPELENAMRSSGQFGPRVVVPDDADPQTRLIAFIGRNP